jgi:phospholipase C
VKFIEYNWRLPALGNGAADSMAGSIQDMFNFRNGGSNPRMFLDPGTGEPISYGYWVSHFKNS